MNKDVVVLIPAYKPDEKLLELLAALNALGFPLLVVDDGSGSEGEAYFRQAEALGARVLRHAVNLGKGRGLKTGMNEILLAYPEALGVVTADADGQHSPEDIASMAEALRKKREAVIIGARNFSQMPPRSQLGNRLIRFFFRKASGLTLSDTQTGLRAIPRAYFPALLTVPGERYEYEMNALLRLNEMGAAFVELPISTIYYDNNKKSHFRTLQDALRVFGSIIRYALSALLSFLLDYGVYALLLATALLQPGAAAATARLFSAGVNYLLNRYVVFKSQSAGAVSGLYYALLAAWGVVALYFGVRGLTALGLPPVLAKVLLDVLLFFFNYFVQRRWIFVDRKAKQAPSKTGER